MKIKINLKKLAVAGAIIGLAGWLRDYYWTKRLCKTLQQSVALRDERIKQLEEIDELKDKISELQIKHANLPGGMLNPIVIKDEEDAPE